MRRPCFPITISSGEIGYKGESRVISISIKGNSSFFKGGKRGSSNAAARAICFIVFVKSASLCILPIQPLSDPFFLNVTKAPHFRDLDKSGG